MPSGLGNAVQFLQDLIMDTLMVAELRFSHSQILEMSILIHIREDAAYLVHDGQWVTVLAHDHVPTVEIPGILGGVIRLTWLCVLSLNSGGHTIGCVSPFWYSHKHQW